LWVSAGHGDCSILKPHVDDATQTENVLATSSCSSDQPPTQFIWANEPIKSTTMHGPHNLSALSSGSQKPFGTLQRCQKWKCVTHQTRQMNPRSHRNPFTTVYMKSAQSTAYPTQYCCASNSSTQPPLGSSHLHLDWDHDPCLVSLHRVLEVLGWSWHRFKGATRGEDTTLFEGGTWDDGGYGVIM
jgi:hypothetical protein